ncbi:MAG: hypothetical protein ACI86P_002332, partial [Flavobacteriales bacterium]
LLNDNFYFRITASHALKFPKGASAWRTYYLFRKISEHYRITTLKHYSTIALKHYSI